MGALIYKISSFKLRSWEIAAKITKVIFKEKKLKIKIQEKGNTILRIMPYHAFIFKNDLLPNIFRSTFYFGTKSASKYILSQLNFIFIRNFGASKNAHPRLY